jgi:hypothetical protein
MTVEGRPAKPGDPEASLRENLAAQVSAAQNELSANLIELRSRGGDAGLIGQADAQLGALLALKSQVDRASPAALASIGASIVACVATASTLAQRALAAINETASRAATELAAASEAARSRVTSFVADFYERKIFDSFLEFPSDADQEAYREREAARRKQIEEAQALRTPQGDLLAIRLARQQLKDAGAHGATNSPAYQQMMDGLDAEDQRLNAAIQASPSPERASMPVSPTADPLDAVVAKETAETRAIAQFRATGVVVAGQSADGHGVATRTSDAVNPRGRI